MKVDVSKNYDELSRKVANEVMSLIKIKPNAVLCLASGNTTLGLYKVLHEYYILKKADFGFCTFIGLDDWLGMDENNPGGCRYYMKKNLINPLSLKPEQIHFFDSKSAFPDEECRRINNIISALGGFDLMILGIGMNGHLGLNEPGSDPGLYAHVTELDEITKKVGQKYFNYETPLKKGITLGLKHIMESRHVILMANGVHKAEIVKQALEGIINNRIPASLIREHHNAAFYLDEEAYPFRVLP
jgi:glucosamine-6-phosphate isomerase